MSFKTVLLAILFFSAAYANAVTNSNRNPEIPSYLSQNGSTKGFQKVLYIVLENTNASVALQQPFFKELTQRGAYLENMNGMVHPSQGNYFTMVAGDAFGVYHDGLMNLNVTHIGDLLEAHGLTWKAYAEGFPGNCFLGETSGKYARKHVPFMSFTNVTSNPTRCSYVVNDKQYDLDLSNNALPNFSFFVPNLDNDGHDTGAAYADKYIEKRFGKLLRDPEFLKDTLVVMTFDESASYFGNSIYTTLIGAGISPGSKNSQRLDHTNILRMIEDEWSLGNLGRGDQSAQPIDGIWK